MRAWVLDEIGAAVRCDDVPEPVVKPGGAVIEVLAAHIPVYTNAVVNGSRGYVFPTPLVLGPACIGRVEAISDDVFNVGSGEEATVREIVEKLITITKARVEPQYDTSQRVLMTRRVGSNARAKERLGWETSIDLDAGLRDVVEWARTR